MDLDAGSDSALVEQDRLHDLIVIVSSALSAKAFADRVVDHMQILLVHAMSMPNV